MKVIEKQPSKEKSKVAPYELPEGWRWVKVGNIVEKLTDGTHSTPKYINEGIPFLSVKNVREEYFDLEDIKYISEDEHKQLTKRCKPERWDILYTKVGTTGIAKVIDIDLEFSIFVSLALIKMDKKNIYPYFLEKVLNSPIVKQQALTKTRGQANKNLVLKDIKEILIPIPSKNNRPDLEKQKQIVHKIETIFAKVEQAEKLRQTALQKTKTAFDAVLNKIFKEAEEKKGWKWIKLSDLGKYINGRAFKPSEWEKSGLPIIRIQNLNNTDAPFNYCSKAVEDKYYIKHGDLLISWSATIDAFIWDKEDAILNQHIFKVEVNKERIEKRYMFYIVKQILQNIVEKTHGSTMKHITYKKFKILLIPLPYKNNHPDLEKQRQIVDYLDRLQGKIKQLEGLQTIQLQKFTALKESILNKAFRGEL